MFGKAQNPNKYLRAFFFLGHFTLRAACGVVQKEPTLMQGNNAPLQVGGQC